MLLQEYPVYLLSSLCPCMCECSSQLMCRYRDGAACWISSSCYLNHTISRNSGTLGRPLLVRQMFLNPPTTTAGSSRPPTSNTKKKKESTLATRWSANLVRSAHLVRLESFFSTKLVGKLTAMLPGLRRIVSQKVQLLKIYTLELPAFMLQSMFRVQIFIWNKAGMNGRLRAHQCWAFYQGGFWEG